MLWTDGLFKCPTRNATASLLESPQHVGATNAFMYHFDHASSFNDKFWGVNYTMCYGDEVCHAEELTYVFRPDVSIANATYTEGETNLAYAMQAYWTEFASIGAPRNGGAINPMSDTMWSPFVQTPPGYEASIKFQVDDVVLQDDWDLDHHKCLFWDTLGYSWLR